LIYQSINQSINQSIINQPAIIPDQTRISCGMDNCRNRTVELWLDSLDPLKELAKLYKSIKE
jgi:hypothetical protein